MAFRVFWVKVRLGCAAGGELDTLVDSGSLVLGIPGSKGERDRFARRNNGRCCVTNDRFRYYVFGWTRDFAALSLQSIADLKEIKKELATHFPSLSVVRLTGSIRQ